MISRAVKTCESCPYKPIDLKLPRLRTINGQKVNICDVDLVIEIGRDIKAIAELKRYQNADSYSKFWLSAHEYVLMKRIASALKTDFFFIIQGDTDFYLTLIDVNERRPTITPNGIRSKQVVFHRYEFIRLQPWQFEQFLKERYVDERKEVVQK
jgi:predicted methyltransferase